MGIIMFGDKQIYNIIPSDRTDWFETEANDIYSKFAQLKKTFVSFGVEDLFYSSGPSLLNSLQASARDVLFDCYLTMMEDVGNYGEMAGWSHDVYEEVNELFNEDREHLETLFLIDICAYFERKRFFFGREMIMPQGYIMYHSPLKEVW